MKCVKNTILVKPNGEQLYRHHLTKHGSPSVLTLIFSIGFEKQLTLEAEAVTRRLSTKHYANTLKIRKMIGKLPCDVLSAKNCNWRQVNRYTDKLANLLLIPSLPHPRNHPAHIGRLPAGRLEQLAVGAAGTGQFGHVGPVDFGVNGIGVNAAVGERTVDDVE